MKKMLPGNEAVARGAWEAGAAVASAYPGTPSTEILENFAHFPQIAEMDLNPLFVLAEGQGVLAADVRIIL